MNLPQHIHLCPPFPLGILRYVAKKPSTTHGLVVVMEMLADPPTPPSLTKAASKGRCLVTSRISVHSKGVALPFFVIFHVEGRSKGQLDTTSLQGNHTDDLPRAISGDGNAVTYLEKTAIHYIAFLVFRFLHNDKSGSLYQHFCLQLPHHFVAVHFPHHLAGIGRKQHAVAKVAVTVQKLSQLEKGASERALVPIGIGGGASRAALFG
mmetsp:Transcript_33659/g.86243  ORF Transcript_33659/g.86243 Transcript_33659/m.86243 type:complete len:208 (+) Transcript_33659:1650-2273(+)